MQTLTYRQAYEMCKQAGLDKQAELDKLAWLRASKKLFGQKGARILNTDVAALARFLKGTRIKPGALRAVPDALQEVNGITDSNWMKKVINEAKTNELLEGFSGADQAARDAMDPEKMRRFIAEGAEAARNRGSAAVSEAVSSVRKNTAKNAPSMSDYYAYMNNEAQKAQRMSNVANDAGKSTSKAVATTGKASGKGAQKGTQKGARKGRKAIVTPYHPTKGQLPQNTGERGVAQRSTSSVARKGRNLPAEQEGRVTVISREPKLNPQAEWVRGQAQNRMEKMNDKYMEVGGRLGEQRAANRELSDRLGKTRAELDEANKKQGQTAKELADAKKKHSVTQKELGETQDRLHKTQDKVIEFFDKADKAEKSRRNWRMAAGGASLAGIAATPLAYYGGKRQGRKEVQRDSNKRNRNA